MQLAIMGTAVEVKKTYDSFKEKINDQKIDFIGAIFLDHKDQSILSIGEKKDLLNLILKYHINELIIALEKEDELFFKELLEKCEIFNINIKYFSSLDEKLYILKNKNIELNNLFSDLSCLLRRKEVGFDLEKISPFFKGKKVLITGGAGTIGSELVVQLLELPVAKIVIYDHAEEGIYKIISTYHDPRLDFIVGDLHSDEKLEDTFRQVKPDLIFHAAAHKHVPLMEYFPDEALRNNVVGTYKVASLSIKYHVEKFIFISTDKAVFPISIMGASKRLCEKLLLSFPKVKNSTHFSIVRFGNVLGSSGSVVPIFRKQIINGGPITITDERMARFFMSIREAARLVIKSASLTEGDIFVLDMGKPVKILTLLKDMIHLSGYEENQFPIEYIGNRGGEKLEEQVFSNKDKLIKTNYEKLLISKEKGVNLDISPEDLLCQVNTILEKKDQKAIVDFFVEKTAYKRVKSSRW